MIILRTNEIVLCNGAAITDNENTECAISTSTISAGQYSNCSICKIYDYCNSGVTFIRDLR